MEEKPNPRVLYIREGKILHDSDRATNATPTTGCGLADSGTWKGNECTTYITAPTHDIFSEEDS